MPGDPQEGNELIPGWLVILHTYGTDIEDGPLSADTSFTWASDRDGELGGGEWLIASNRIMSLGEHVIILTGTDSDGRTSTTTRITITAGDPERLAAKSFPFWWFLVGAILLLGGIGLAVFVVRCSLPQEIGPPLTGNRCPVKRKFNQLYKEMP